MPILGIIASSAKKPTAFESITTTTLSTTTASITFSSIPTTYTALQIRAISKIDIAGYQQTLYCRFNGDTGTTYSWHNLEGNGSSAGSAGSTGSTHMRIYHGGSGTTLANTFGVLIADIYNYNSTSQTKVIRSFSGSDNNTGGGAVALSSGLWNSTSAVTSIQFYNDTSFLAGTTFALYGIKG